MAAKSAILPVIMSGGSGTRLWPLSTDDRPKQFHALASELSMIQETARRFRTHDRLDFLPALVICNARHGETALEQLQAQDLTPADVILEPFGRNTAAVAVIAARWAEENASGARILLLPADHVVGDVETFREVVERALPAAQDHIVTLGIEPSGPETGYGYIQRGEPLGEGVFKVSRFIEKPSLATAEAYLAEGGYVWNAGIFLYSSALLLAEAERLCPEVLEAASAALCNARRSERFLLLDAEAFGRCPSMPVDIAIMERTRRAAVTPCAVGWADVGSWSELWRQGPLSAEGNIARGDVLALDTHDSVLWSDGPKVATVGLDGFVVVATREHVLVVPKDRAQDVKRLVEAMKKGSS